MRRAISKFLDDAFIKQNIIFFIGSMAVAVLNYLYHPILGRLMNVADFGEVQVLISLSLQLTVLLSVFGIIATNIIARQEAPDEKKHAIDQLYSFAVYFTSGMSVIFLLLIPELKDAFHFSTAYPFFVLVGFIAASTQFTFQKSFLQGTHKFGTVSYANIIVSAGRLVLGVLLVLLGFYAFGAIIAILIAQVLASGYVLHRTRGQFALSFNFKIHFSKIFLRELAYGFLVLCAIGFTTFLYTADVIFVKHYLSPEIAGVYSGIATIARIIYFATTSISAVLLPMVTFDKSPRENSWLLFKAMAFLTLIGGGVLLIFTLFPSLVVHMLIGSNYVALAPLLPRLSLVLWIAACVNLFFFYFLALRNYLLIPISLFGLALASILIMQFHATPTELVDDFLWTSIASLGLVAALYVSSSFKKR